MQASKTVCVLRSCHVRRFGLDSWLMRDHSQRKRCLAEMKRGSQLTASTKAPDTCVHPRWTISAEPSLNSDPQTHGKQCGWCFMQLKQTQKLYNKTNKCHKVICAFSPKNLLLFWVPFYQLILLSFASCPWMVGLWKVHWKSRVLFF